MPIKKIAAMSIALAAGTLSTNALAARCTLYKTASATGCTTSWVAVPAGQGYSFDGYLRVTSGSTLYTSVEFSVLRGDGVLIYLQKLELPSSGETTTGIRNYVNRDTTQRSFQSRLKFFSSSDSTAGAGGAMRGD